MIEQSKLELHTAEQHSLAISTKYVHGGTYDKQKQLAAYKISNNKTGARKCYVTISVSLKTIQSYTRNHANQVVTQRGQATTSYIYFIT